MDSLIFRSQFESEFFPNLGHWVMGSPYFNYSKRSSRCGCQSDHIMAMVLSRSKNKGVRKTVYISRCYNCRILRGNMKYVFQCCMNGNKPWPAAPTVSQPNIKIKTQIKLLLTISSLGVYFKQSLQKSRNDFTSSNWKQHIYLR